MWWKFMINVGINQTSAVLKAPYKFFQQEKECRVIMEGAMREVIEISKKVGANLTEEDLTNWYSILNKLGPENKTSMLQDIEAGRRTEVDVFGGKVCELGRKYNVATPINDTLVKLIKALENIG
jgi:2-dehydropantoate 2-reductase